MLRSRSGWAVHTAEQRTPPSAAFAENRGKQNYEASSHVRPGRGRHRRRGRTRRRPGLGLDQPASATLDHRIDQGIKNGSLTAGEATRLRAEFRLIANLEAQYRRSNGVFTNAERTDLDRRMSVLSAKITAQRSDWRSVNQRQAELDRRIDVGVRNGSLTNAEAGRLRAEFRGIANLEGQYRRSGGGLNQWERNDLDRRMTALAAKIRTERSDRQSR